MGWTAKARAAALAARKAFGQGTKKHSQAGRVLSMLRGRTSALTSDSAQRRLRIKFGAKTYIYQAMRSSPGGSWRIQHSGTGKTISTGSTLSESYDRAVRTLTSSKRG